MTEETKKPPVILLGAALCCNLAALAYWNRWTTIKHSSEPERIFSLQRWPHLVRDY